MGLGKEVPGETADDKTSGLQELSRVSRTKAEKVPEMEVGELQVKLVRLEEEGDSDCRNPKKRVMFGDTKVDLGAQSPGYLGNDGQSHDKNWSSKSTALNSVDGLNPKMKLLSLEPPTYSVTQREIECFLWTPSQPREVMVLFENDPCAGCCLYVSPNGVLFGSRKKLI